MTPRLPFLRLPAALLTVFFLAACDGKPAGWAAIDSGFLSSLTSKGCPDLTGTYRLHPRRDGDGNVIKIAVFGPRMPNTHANYPWETMTISGDSAIALQLTFSRSAETMAAIREKAQEHERKFGANIAAENFSVMFSPKGRQLPRFAAMSDDEYESYLQKTFAWPTRSVTVQHGVHYQCSGGWLEDHLGVDGVPGQREDGHPVERFTKSAKLARDQSGHLVAHHVSMVRQSLPLWCGDGCKGIPLGMWENHAWGRWAAAEPAWSGPMPRPWAENLPQPKPAAKPEPIITRMSLSAGNFPGRLRPLLPQGARLGLVETAGSRYRFTIYAETQAQISELLRNLDASSDFANPELEHSGKSAAGTYEAKIVVRDKSSP